MMELPEKFKFISPQTDNDTVFTAEKEGDGGLYTVCWLEAGVIMKSAAFHARKFQGNLRSGFWKIISEEPSVSTNAETIKALKARVDSLEKALEGLKKESVNNITVNISCEVADSLSTSLKKSAAVDYIRELARKVCEKSNKDLCDELKRQHLI